MIPSEAVNVTGDEQIVKQLIAVSSFDRLWNLTVDYKISHPIFFTHFLQVFEDKSEVPDGPFLDRQYLRQDDDNLSTVCLTNREYYSMIGILFIFMGIMITVTITAGIYYK